MLMAYWPVFGCRVLVAVGGLVAGFWLVGLLLVFVVCLFVVCLVGCLFWCCGCLF